MTVSTTTTKAIYNGDGSTTGFPTTFEFFDAADIEVIERVIATGGETVKTLNTDYTVSGGNGATGTVTAVTAPASTVQWAIRRKTPLTQQIDYVENDDFPAETHEEGLDRGVMIAQERQEELDRALKFPVSDAASLDPEIPNSVDRAGQFLAFDVSGNPMAAAGVSGVPVSAFMQTLLDDADAPTARATLGAAGLTDANTFTDTQKWAKGADIASAAALAPGTDGNYFDVTGTTEITSINSLGVGTVIKLHFDASLTLTHNAVDLVLPGGADITTAAGDEAEFIEYATGDWRVTNFSRADGTAVSASGGKNVVINGNFDIWQRGTSFTAAVNATFSADRYRWGQVGSAVVDLLRSTSVPDNTSDFSLQVDVTTADVSIAAGDIYIISYKVEGYDAMRFGFGTADAKQLTLSFWVRSAKTGIHCVSFQNAAIDRSYVVEYTVDAADTWEYKTITLTADTAGTWLTDNGVGVEISWALAVGTDTQGPANSWNAANDVATSNQVNCLDNAANNFHLARAQLEVGGVATDFERRPFPQELALCQRYYAKSYDAGVDPGTINGSGRVSLTTRQSVAASTAGSIREKDVDWPAGMRDTPTVVLYSDNTGTSAAIRNISAGNDRSGVTAASIGHGRSSELSVDATGANAISLDHQLSFHFTADAEL